LGIVLSGRRKGFCDALRWEAGTNTYRCGAIIDPQAVMHHALPRGLKAWSIVMAPWLRRLAGRWIAAGTGCDCDLDVVVGVQSDRQSGT
jgi:hypothetical protein